ncbi:DUF5686 family protein [Flavobacterium aurantiibacter]|nr:DUF5686 family protein [Flavobacterium aurantiibacter]
MQKFSVTLFFMLLFFTAHGQQQLRGLVIDSNTARAVSGVSIVAGNRVTATDINGYFEIEVQQLPALIKISALDYESQEYRFADVFPKQIKVHSKPKQAETIRNATALLQKVIANKRNNDPLKKLQTFEIEAYNKVVVTANAADVDAKLDTVYKRKWLGKKRMEIDSSSVKFKALVQKQHLFDAEKVSKFQLSKGNFKETITAARMSGLQTPIYELVAFRLQSFSVYENYFEVLQTRYASPLNASEQDLFQLTILDTIQLSKRNLAVLHFENKKSRKKGLSGILYCDLENFAIAAAVFRVQGVLDVTARYEFSYDAESSLYIISKKEFKVVKGKNNKDISILGETFQFDPEDSPIYRTRKQQLTDITYLLSQTHYENPKLNTEVTIKKAAIALQINDAAVRRPVSYWNEYMQRYPDEKSPETYRKLDSLVRAEGIESKLRIGRKILNGYVPFSFFDMDLRQLLSYNNFEGFRLGVGGITNERLSQYIKFDGYYAFGTKDRKAKYSLGTAVRIGKFSSSWIGAGYSDDIREIASTSYTIDKRVFKLYDPRPINISTFYNYRSVRAYAETKIIPKTESIWQFQHMEVTPLFNYLFNYNGQVFDNFTLSTFQASVQWNPFSDFMQTPTGRVEIYKRYPRFTFQLTKSVKDIFGSNFDFQKLDVRVDYQKKFIGGERFSILLEAGMASGAVPLTHLYNTAPNNLTKDRLLQRITIAGKNSFETMFFNEFFSSSFAALHVKHGFKPLQISGKIRPLIVLVTRGAVGTMRNRERHVGIPFKTLDKGFLESGLELNKIYSGFGLTAFYRYGPNQLPRLEDNIAIKLSFMLNLGF